MSQMSPNTYLFIVRSVFVLFRYNAPAYVRACPETFRFTETQLASANRIPVFEINAADAWELKKKARLAPGSMQLAETPTNQNLTNYLGGEDFRNTVGSR